MGDTAPALLPVLPKPSLSPSQSLSPPQSLSHPCSARALCIVAFVFFFLFLTCALPGQVQSAETVWPLPGLGLAIKSRGQAEGVTRIWELLEGESRGARVGLGGFLSVGCCC